MYAPAKKGEKGKVGAPFHNQNAVKWKVQDVRRILKAMVEHCYEYVATIYVEKKEEYGMNKGKAFTKSGTREVEMRPYSYKGILATFRIPNRRWFEQIDVRYCDPDSAHFCEIVSASLELVKIAIANNLITDALAGKINSNFAKLQAYNLGLIKEKEEEDVTDKITKLFAQWDYPEVPEHIKEKHASAMEDYKQED